MSAIIWILILLGIVIYFYWIKVIRPKQNKKLLKESLYHSENLEGFIKKNIHDKIVTSEDTMVLSTLLFKDVLSSFIWDYHRKKNSKGLKVLLDLEKDSYKQASIINEIKNTFEKQCKDQKMTSYSFQSILENTRIKCNKLVAPSASLYGN